MKNSLFAMLALAGILLLVNGCGGGSTPPPPPPPTTYTVTLKLVGATGTLSATSVVAGGTVSVTDVGPASGYQTPITATNCALSGTTCTSGAINTNMTITLTGTVMPPVKYSVNFTAGIGMTWNPTYVAVEAGQTASSTPTLSPGYKSLMVDGVAVTSGALYTTRVVNSNTTVTGSATPDPVVNATVVMRVVLTSPSWGQEPIFSWPNDSPVKDAPGYSLYDVEIGDDANEVPIYVKLFKFTDWSVYKLTTLTPAQYAQYVNDCTLVSIAIPPGDTTTNSGVALISSQVLSALDTITDVVFQREKNPTRVVLDYSGHGGPGGFFFGSRLLTPDSVAFMKHLRSVTSGETLVMDFSGPCDEGNWDTVVNFFPYADYMIATDKVEGGYESGPNFATYGTMDSFWNTNNSTFDAMSATVANVEAVWNDSYVSLQSLQLEQSISVYNLAEFQPLMDALAGDSAFAATDLPNYSSDIGTYIYDADPRLVAPYESFRIVYGSDRNLVTWTDDSRGFGVADIPAFQIYLESLQ